MADGKDLACWLEAEGINFSCSGFDSNDLYPM